MQTRQGTVLQSLQDVQQFLERYADKLGNIPATGARAALEQLIADRVPGVTLDHGYDGRLMLRIRGTTSSWSNAQPLYVVDGFPLMTVIGGSPVVFNTADISRLEVLKDASSTAMYGGRGGAGVILIETKKR